MATTTVRISEQTHQVLGRLAKQEGISMQAVIEKALDMYRRRQFLQDLNNAYASLKNDEEAWKSVQHECSLWDATLGDGLDDIDDESQLKNIPNKSPGSPAS